MENDFSQQDIDRLLRERAAKQPPLRKPIDDAIDKAQTIGGAVLGALSKFPEIGASGGVREFTY